MPDENEWITIIRTAAEHSLLGVLFLAVERIRQTNDIPPEVYLNLGTTAEAIKEKNLRQRAGAVHVHQLFLENGFKNCILKGQASGVLYPQPLLRQSGDIDIWLESGREKIMAFLKAHFPIRKTRYIHCEAKILKGAQVEVHFTPSWMFSPRANRRLQRWFDACAPEQFAHVDDTLGFSIPTLRFNGTYMLLHIYRHVLEEGIGLRQFMDYFYVLKHMDEEDRIIVNGDLKKLGLYRFSAAVMYVLQQIFLADDHLLLCQPDRRRGAMLLDSVLQSGNFGHSDPVFANPDSKSEGILAHGWRKIKRNLHLLALCPSEILWMPWFVTWQYFWRRRNGYLYKGR